MAHAARPLGGRARNPSPGPARPPPPFAAADAAAAAGLRDAPRRVARMKVIIGADSAFLVFFLPPTFLAIAVALLRFSTGDVLRRGIVGCVCVLRMYCFALDKR